MQRLKHLTRWASDVAAAAIAAMAVLTVADILMKNALNRPIKGTFELVELLLTIVVFLGIAEVFRSDGNVCVDVADQVLSPRRLAWLKILGAFAALGFLLLMGWAMLAPAMDTVAYPQYTQETGISLAVYWLPILAGTALAVIAAAALAWTLIRARSRAG